ncbi:MAG: hypothetical protein DWQ31_08345 [Planctomycetota bacterium]|nr:MAG: hypothetical protein DWQ31_08345 [Planctomycetota bacterium]REJ90918.1 MAG: hypothetical protein DWQ35_15655 [Planctomycetota bacterium]REK17695.1 MAG: hypothetical protein DWQ42_21870 [Planctomycetota bacterium]REK46748.1 MAG: hypothetical protein DWQ46_05980 [Planctomycetota bacterium]
MDCSSVFVILAELRPLEGCEIDPCEVAGAAVRFYICGRSAEAANRKLSEWVVENHFEIVEIDWCVDEANVEWEYPDDKIAEELISEARNSGDVVYGEFHAWRHDAPDA